MSSPRAISEPGLVQALAAVFSEQLTAWSTRLLQFVDLTVGRSRMLRLVALTALYGLLLAASFFLAYELRWDFDPPKEFIAQRVILILPIVACKLFLLNSFGQFRSVLSYFGLADFGGVAVSMAIASAIMLALWLGADASSAPPRGVILMDLVLSVSSLSTFRLALRVARTRSSAGAQRGGEAEQRVAIIGAGDLGEAVAKDLLAKRSRYAVRSSSSTTGRIGSGG